MVRRTWYACPVICHKPVRLSKAQRIYWKACRWLAKDHRDRGNDKQTRTVNVRQVCAYILSLFYNDHHRDQKHNDELRHKQSTLITLDDPRHRTQLGGNMIIANISSNPQVQGNNEEQLWRKLVKCLFRAPNRINRRSFSFSYRRRRRGFNAEIVAFRHKIEKIRLQVLYLLFEDSDSLFQLHHRCVFLRLQCLDTILLAF